VKKIILPACLLGLLSACAHEPIVDRHGVDEDLYHQDLAECRAYAEEADTLGETTKRAAVGAAIGTTVGAIIGNHHTAERGAGVGAVAGGTRGFRDAEHRKEHVLYRCMEKRGYEVLG
jgi:uncharacterized protein YcfJ